MEEIELLKEYLSYDPDTGKFTWIKKPSRRVVTGREAGVVNSRGYVQIGFSGKTYYAHRLAYLFMKGEWPEHGVDHKDGDLSNNKWDNLRESTQSQNLQNLKSSKETGTHYYKRDSKWQSSIGKDGKKYHLGYFDTQEEAHQAYVMAKKDMHEFQPEPRYTEGESNQ